MAMVVAKRVAWCTRNRWEISGRQTGEPSRPKNEGGMGGWIWRHIWLPEMMMVSDWTPKRSSTLPHPFHFRAAHSYWPARANVTTPPTDMNAHHPQDPKAAPERLLWPQKKSAESNYSSFTQKRGKLLNNFRDYES